MVSLINKRTKKTLSIFKNKPPKLKYYETPH